MDRGKYIPFNNFTGNSVLQLISAGAKYIVLQRFQWPGIDPGKGFMATPYNLESTANAHVHNLEANEGKVVSLDPLPDKVRDMLISRDYNMFINTVKETKWKNELLRYYRQNIYSYLRSNTEFTTKSPIDIDIYFENGRLTAKLTSNDKTHLTTVYKLIN